MVPKVTSWCFNCKVRVFVDVYGCSVYFVILTYILRYNLYGLALFIDLIILVGVVCMFGVRLTVFFVLLFEIVVILMAL